jgi:hypothetical protein
VSVPPARLNLGEPGGKLDAEIRPAHQRDLFSAVGGIGLAIAVLIASPRLSMLGWLIPPVQIAAALTIAFMLRRLVYFAGSFMTITADGQTLTLSYPKAGMKKELPTKSLTRVCLTNAEGSPLAGINMGPLGGSLWCEADGRYVCFGRGLSEEDARRLAERINVILGKNSAEHPS